MPLIPKTITMTYLLRNPAKVRELVAQGMILSVEYDNKVVMNITPPPAINTVSESHPPQYKMAQPNWKQDRNQIHDKEY